MKKKIKNQYKKILIFIAIFSIISTVFINVSSANMEKNSKCFLSENYYSLSVSKNDNATKPNWEVTNFWEYDMDFTFDAKTTKGLQILNVDGNIPSMIATLIEKDEREYILDLNGNIDGGITFSIGDHDISNKDMSGTIGGNAYIGRNDLSMREFVFEVDGKVGPIMGKKRDLSFDMTMNFDPEFDFFDFPIEPDEGIWQVIIDKATLEADVYIDVFGGLSKEIKEHTDFIDNMSYKGKENVNNYECFKIGGDWGDPSDLWYAPEAGFLAKVRESIDFSGKTFLIQADFNLDLINTNYDPSNKPPNKPQILSGPDEGLTDETYTFTFNGTDPEKNPISYRVDWDDGSISDWTEYHDSGEIVSAEHSWSKKGSYNVKVQAKDENGASKWSDSKSVLIKGDPIINVTIISIEKLDEIDPDCSAPEWYYYITLDSTTIPFEDKSEKSNGTWIANNSHEFDAYNRNVSIEILLMEDDGIYSPPDIADISNRTNADGDPGLLGTQLEEGRVFKIRYDLVTDKIISGDRTEKVESNQDSYFPRYTSGEWDGSGKNNPEDLIDNDWKQDDANLSFNITNDYELPKTTANITNIPETIRPGDELQFCGSVEEGTPLYSWFWDFGDEKTSNEQNPKYSYETSGTYNVRLTVTDGFGQSSSDFLEVKVNENQAPITSSIYGASQGKKGETYTYTFLAEDPEGDNIQYFVDWGDGTDTGWTDEHLSGLAFVEDHSWDEKNTYTIKFRARDDPNGDGDFSDGMISDWETLEVSMPKNKVKPLSILYYLRRDDKYRPMLDFLIYLFF